MQSYRTVITVADPNQIVLDNVPVQPGDRVEVTVRPQGKQRTEMVDRMKQLLEETHALPQLETISEEEIAAEIADFRNNGQCLTQTSKTNFSQRREDAKERKTENRVCFFLCVFAPLRETFLVSAVTVLSFSLCSP